MLIIFHKLFVLSVLCFVRKVFQSVGTEGANKEPASGNEGNHEFVMRCKSWPIRSVMS